MKGFWSLGLMVVGVLSILGSVEGDLQMGFYSSSCPKAEKIVQDFVNQHIPNAPSLAATLIRMNFHDCFVRGCDGSVLLNFTSSSGNQTEKVAVPNRTLRGFGFIDAIKSLVEAECPGVVSCADIIALAARDSIVLTGGPSWKVPTGRRDGLLSNASEALAQIPAPTDNITILIQKFANKSLDLKDLVLLSGAHTIGIAHCPSIMHGNAWGVPFPYRKRFGNGKRPETFGNAMETYPENEKCFMLIGDAWCSAGNVSGPYNHVSRLLIRLHN